MPLPPSAETIRYRPATDVESAAVDLLDQTKLPGELCRLVCETKEELHDAIQRLVVRGAPAIGIAAAYGVNLTKVPNGSDAGKTKQAYFETIDYLATSRPTAVNLFWALDRMREVVQECRDDELELLSARLAQKSIAIHEDDRAMCAAIGLNGSQLLSGLSNVLTHCNAGSLATSTLGTALAPIYHLHDAGESLHVYADETRPLLQGARLTAWELSMAGVSVTVCTDSMAGSLMRLGNIDAVIVGADRIAASGDVANKIGTYPLAVLARHHGLPFYVAAPTNTFDRELASGDEIPIEQRHGDEISWPGGRLGNQTVPNAAQTINPAFDVTPADLVTAIITERGVIELPDRDRVMAHLG